MATSQGGFQILLDAEQEANALVNEARQCKVVVNLSLIYSVDRTQRLRDARTEALAEIEALKKQKEQELVENDKTVTNPITFFQFL